MTGLRLDGVDKSFGGVHAVSDVSIDVPPGSIVGLIGPNGAGKTTVINLITGILSLSSGRITLDGRDISEAGARELTYLGIARTFQNIRILREETVLANIAIGFHRHETASFLANLLGLPAARRERTELERRALGLLERFGIEHLAGALAGALSYGDQRRVEVVRALATGPKFLLLDEPVAGMNDVEAEALAAFVRDLNRSGLSILVVEHNIPFVASLCSRIYVMNAGKLISSGDPAHVLSDPVVIDAYLGD